MCNCNLTGYIEETICINHLKEAFDKACSDKDTELAAVILKKHRDLQKV